MCSSLSLSSISPFLSAYSFVSSAIGNTSFTSSFLLFSPLFSFSSFISVFLICVFFFSRSLFSTLPSSRYFSLICCRSIFFTSAFLFLCSYFFSLLQFSFSFHSFSFIYRFRFRVHSPPFLSLLISPLSSLQYLFVCLNFIIS